MRIGPRFNADCQTLQLAGKCLQFIDSVKYLGVGLCVAVVILDVHLKRFS